MILNVTAALQLAPVVLDLGMKIFSVIRSGEPQDISDEIKRLQACRLRPSDEIIAEADRARAIDAMR